MNFYEYQQQSEKTAIYPSKIIWNSSGPPIPETDNIFYPALGLAGEAGEIANKVKKVMRDTQGGKFTDSFVKDMEKELGDVLWYISSLASKLGLSLENIAKNNIEKLQKRAASGTIIGSGDNR